MPNLQIRLARTEGLSKAEQLFAQYPVPNYMLQLNHIIDPALLMAVARNESGFREIAHSPSGAIGMMQMLPSTARAVERQVGEDLLRTADAADATLPLAERLSNPMLSARYGAQYLKLLTQQPVIGQNLIHLLVGYNAGPGTVASWKAAAGDVRDPLLYVESIPYAETRNYVMQVAAQYWVYQRMMDETPTSLVALAKGQWPTLARTRS
jgi:soluble lytic murein transglycosylase-like protein